MWMHYNLGTSFHAGCNPALRSSLEGRNFVSRLVEIEARLQQEGLEATGLQVLEAFLRGHAGEEASNGRSKEQNLQTISALLEILPRKKAYYCFMEKSKSVTSYHLKQELEEY
ncbi:hypothetical protein BSKO_06117 [Bryopsis sp. KO-2023]|nr:hypothetical protein BSKO_06117 [Bryopsis sp. KO-2023]